MTFEKRGSGFRRRHGVLAAATILAAAALSSAPPVRADSAAFIGPWGASYARYEPGRFGPERPLREVLSSAGVDLGPDGKLPGARLLIIKDARRCELWVGERMVKAYRIQLSQHSRGTKKRRYDQRTPEGEYAICAHRPSKYHRGLWINYPSLADAERALSEKRLGAAQHEQIRRALEEGNCPPQNTKLGGYVMLHGQQKSLTASLRRAARKSRAAPRAGFQPGDADPRTMRQYYDWTAGCIALFNPDIRELYDLLPDGTPVRIVGDAPATLPTAPAAPRAGREAPLGNDVR